VMIVGQRDAAVQCVREAARRVGLAVTRTGQCDA
jgi:hypothetical protein